MLDGVQNFEREVVATGGKFSDRAAYQVVGDDGGDGGRQSGGGCDQGFGNARSDCPQGSCTGRAQAVEGVNNAPHRAKQTDEGSYGRGDREPGHVPFQARDLFRCANLHAAPHPVDAELTRVACNLSLVFLVTALENSHQRTGAKLIRDGSDILHSLSLAKCPDKSPTLHPRAPKQAPLGQNDGPRDHAEGEQNQKDSLGDRSCVRNHVQDCAAHENAQQREDLHEVSEELLDWIIDDCGLLLSTRIPSVNSLFHRYMLIYASAGRGIQKNAHIFNLKARGWVISSGRRNTWRTVDCYETPVFQTVRRPPRISAARSCMAYMTRS